MTPDGLNHVFFGDSGSVGVEIALKLAVQYWYNIGRPKKNRILSLKQAYHGDTCGAMSVGDPADPKHQQFAGLVREQYFVDSPRSGFKPDAALLAKEIKALEETLTAHSDELAAFIVEPLMQAAGGFNFYSPQYLQAARKACSEHEVLLIFDEVATGFGRTGSMFAADQAQVSPDIMILGKALTAGYFGHSATLTTTRIFESFHGDDFERAFMHGPTFMGNAVTCAVALKSLEIFERDKYLNKIAHIASILKEHFLPIRSRAIRDTRVLGATGVIEVHDKQEIRGIGEFAVERGVWLRPIDRCVYIMPPYVINDEPLLKVIGVIKEWFDQF
ncbi:MAG: aminotransferase class III-fold pyridoxal phosphate-dependent enzyme, partial [Planctomycetes bacterium]|nr:aminotransferase class III-fold pyridoxal phosphate-dependent enzyme [Planctomycetota bacterium]